MAKQDYYHVLGVKRGATAPEIRSAYRKLAKQYHPDVNKTPGAEDKFKEATEAYEVLGDPQKRSMYDQFGHATPGAGFGGGPGRGPGGGLGASFEEILGAARAHDAAGAGGFMGMSLDDILGALRGRKRASHQSRRGGRGPDAKYELTLDFMQAMWGTTTSIRLTEPGSKGRTETIEVKIPPGVDDGSRIRLRGKGGPGPAGPGDLYIVVHVRPHPYFCRDGDDIYLDVPISISEAALGARIDVPTIDGMMTVTVPPGTAGGKRLRLKGKGVHGVGGKSRGHQYVVIRIVPPEELTAKGRKLLEEFGKIHSHNPRTDAPWT